MTRTPRTFLVAATAAAVLAPLVLGAQIPFPRGRAQIRGTVRDSLTGQPIVRTRVCSEVELPTPYGRGVLCASPDSLGGYVLDSLPAGRRVVTATCAGRKLLGGRLLRQDTVALGETDAVRLDVPADTTGCDMRPFVERHGEFSGYYRSGFEESRFSPCGAPASAWVEFGPRASAQRIRWPKPNDRYYPTYFVRWVGTLRGPWQYGHLGVSPYEFVVDSVLAVRRPGRRTGCPA